MGTYDDLVHALRRGDYTSAVNALSKQATEATRIIHVDTVTPVDAAQQPGQGPTPVVLGGGSVLGLQFDVSTEQAFRIIKIPTNYVGDASFHIHWTKNVNTNQAGATVRWRLTYKVYNGATDDVTAGAQTLLFDDTYDDSGTTTRIVYRTANVSATGLVAGSYLGVRLDYIPANTTLSGGPVAVSADLLMRVTINSDS